MAAGCIPLGSAEGGSGVKIGIQRFGEGGVAPRPRGEVSDRRDHRGHDGWRRDGRDPSEAGERGRGSDAGRPGPAVGVVTSSLGRLVTEAARCGSWRRTTGATAG